MRHLRWQTPHMKGPDVERLQKAVGVAVDGDYGGDTASAVRRSKSLLGFPKEALDSGASVFYQEILFGIRKAPDSYAKLAIQRKAAADAGKTDGEKAVDWLAPFVGKTERDGLNRGSWGLDVWQEEAGHAKFQTYAQMGWAWCGVTVHAAYLHGAKVNLDNRVVSVEWISAAARAGSGGLYAVPLSQVRKGDMLTMFGNDHVELSRGPVSGTSVPTRGGNTSFADGSQNDGGALADKTRHTSDIVTAARVRKEA